MGAPKGGKGEWGLCLWATLPNSELANAAFTASSAGFAPAPVCSGASGQTRPGRRGSSRERGGEAALKAVCVLPLRSLV